METLKDIPWYEWLYQASELWNIMSLNYKNKWYPNILTPIKQSDWYYNIWLYKNKKFKQFRIHRLIMITYKGKSKLDVNHKDGNKSNNKLENLEYCTRSENQKHSYRKLWRTSNFITDNPRSMKWKFGKLHHSSKKVYQYSRMWELIKTWDSWMDIHRELWISRGNISDCCKWRVKTAWGFIWKYELIW